MLHNFIMAKDYYVHPSYGNDNNTGLSKEQAFKTLERVSKVNLLPGDRVLLASGETFFGALSLVNKQGKENNPIQVTSVLWDPNGILVPATIDFKGIPNGILIEDCSYINISNIQLTANGHFKDSEKQSKMRCGVMISNNKSKLMEHITLDDLAIFDVYYENKGYLRGDEEVRTANGKQKYGWGIRILSNNSNGQLQTIKIQNCNVKSVSHTGIKLTGNNKNISNIEISNNTVESTGGPGIQMSEVKDVHVFNNKVTHSGSSDDSRKWGRGSGLWTWGSSHVLIEHNKFLYANGPGDSAGAHIDFNCDNIVIQYNLSAYNAGGFCEILGNNYNCSYRYNISINDGHRIKGENNAFQEGKIFWLSGYQGEKKIRKGPVNTYFYNNTIYVDSTIVSKIAVDNTSNGILIANNIFYLKGDSKVVLGDQYKPDKVTGEVAENVYFKNNLFLNKDNWPKGIGINDTAPFIGNPEFANGGGLEAKDYMPKNLKLVQQNGIEILQLPNDSVGLMQSLKLEKDILGNPIKGQPSLGAIVPIKSTYK